MSLHSAGGSQKTRQRGVPRVSPASAVPKAGDTCTEKKGDVRRTLEITKSLFKKTEKCNEHTIARKTRFSEIIENAIQFTDFS